MLRGVLGIKDISKRVSDEVFGNFGWEFLLGGRMKWGERIQRRGEKKRIKKKTRNEWLE